VTGNNNIGNYAWVSTLSSYNYVLGNQVALGRGVASIPNDNLHWETAHSQNYGIDLGLFKNRITASFSVYRRKNNNLLLHVPILAVTGYTSYLENIGAVRNKGWNLTIKTNVKSRGIGGFSWNTDLNISHNRNKVLSLEPGQNEIQISPEFGSTPYFIMKRGLPMNSIYVVKQNGVLTKQNIKNNYPTFGNNQKVGDPRYIDANGDGKINSDDRQVVGQPYPTIYWGITNQFHYKGLSLSVLVQGQEGGYIYSLLGRAINRTGMGVSDNALAINPKTRGNWKTTYGFFPNTDWLYKSNYISIRDVTLSYNLMSLFSNSATNIKNARIYISADNWFYWDDYYGGFNPEANNTALSSNGNYPIPGDYGGAPIPKSINFGIDLTF
jgi:hypothetical protein